MKTFLKPGLVLLVWNLTLTLALPQEAKTNSPTEIFAAALAKIVNVIEPLPGTPPQTLSAQVKVLKADGVAKELKECVQELAFQAPDRLYLSGTILKNRLDLGRDGQQLWIYAPMKKFGLVGVQNVARFAAAPDQKDTTKLKPIELPVPRAQLALLPLVMKVELLPAEKVGGVNCQVVSATPQPQAVAALKLPNGQLQLWIRDTDQLPARLGYSDGKGLHVLLEFQDLKLGDPWPEKWKLTALPDSKVETVALAHVSRFIPALLSIADQHIPTLGPATGERRVIATEGQGRLEVIDGTKVLCLKGTPEEMGRQHGKLMAKEVKDLVERVLYGIGVGSSFEKGRWFFGEIEQALARLKPFIADRYLQEMDAIALAADVEQEEIRLANFFPELFHCSGFALYGNATTGGRIFHGRILDYMKGIGLEQNAVVIVHQPEQGNAWANISYAGFVGSVTAMNEKHVAIGEMGGRGEGNWDGKPMAQLMREVMEQANTIDEAVEIMRQGPRTCEYYYVISDGKSKRAVGIAATPTKFETIWAGQSHAQLPHKIKDAVLMSAGDRYEKLVERVKAGHGKFDVDSARKLMERPVAMTSNIHSVLFAPDTLDFWVANADSKNVASHTRYTRYNLAELLKGPPAGEVKATAAK